MVKLTEEKTRSNEIKKLVKRVMGDSKDTERAVKILASTGVRTEAEIRKVLTASAKMSGSLLAVLLESEMDAKTARGLRLAIPHIISLVMVAHAPGFRDRFRAHLALAKKRFEQGGAL